MCYYNGIKVPRDEYIRLMNIEKGVRELMKMLAKPLQSGFEYTNYPIIKPINGGCDFEIVEAHWEFIGSWLKTWNEVVESRKKYNTLNAKAENLFVNEKGQKSMWADAAKNRRCLVLSSGFYEWRHYKPDGSKKEIAYPYYVTIPGRDYFFMAGVWQAWTDRETGETIDTFAIVTSKANSLMAQIHNKKLRMPTILPDELASEWIQEGLSEEKIQQLGNFQYPSEKMSGYTIEKDFRSLEEPQIPFNYKELPNLTL